MSLSPSKREPLASYPQIDPALCTRCLKCLASCPEGAIADCKNDSCAKCVKYCLSMPVPCKPGALVVSTEFCTGCGECIAACAYGAISWTKLPTATAEGTPLLRPGENA